MSFEATSSASRRGRVMAVAGLAAAATVGGLVFATSAQAATAPTLTLTAPAQVLNSNNTTTPPTLSIEVNNAASGNAVIPPAGGSATLQVTISGVAGLACANISLNAENTGPTTIPSALSPALTLAAADLLANGTCHFQNTAFTQDPNTDVTYNYGLVVNAATQTGTLSSVASLVVKDAGANIIANVTSLPGTTALVAPSAQTAPVFNTATPPAAAIFQPYSFQELTSLGNPVTDPATGFSVFYRPAMPDSNGVYSCSDTGTLTTGDLSSVYNPTTHVSDDAYYLNNGFYLDTVTGYIVNSDPRYADNVPQTVFTIIANNGTGGSTSVTTIAGVGCGGHAVPTPDVAHFDVVSPSFQLPVLFKDVPLSGAFADEIYALASEGVINGYADGTFRSTAAISRQAFAALLAREILHPYPDSATCNAVFNPSAFPDVPNSSPFCQEIRDLAAHGIINGYSDGKFHPGSTITRQAVAALLYRAHAYDVGATIGDAVCTTPVPFNDVTTSNPFCGDIEWMASNHYSTGYADGGYHPYATTSRQATAAFIFRIFFA